MEYVDFLNTKHTNTDLFVVYEKSWDRNFNYIESVTKKTRTNSYFYRNSPNIDFSKDIDNAMIFDCNDSTMFWLIKYLEKRCHLNFQWVTFSEEDNWTILEYKEE